MTDAIWDRLYASMKAKEQEQEKAAQDALHASPFKGDGGAEYAAKMYLAMGWNHAVNYLLSEKCRLTTEAMRDELQAREAQAQNMRDKYRDPLGGEY